MANGDYKLMDAALAGDDDALNEFFFHTSKLLYKIIPNQAAALGFRISREDGEDINQAIILSFLKKNCHRLRAFERRASFSTWLNTVATNALIDHVRSKRFRNDRRTTSINKPLSDDPDAVTLEDVLHDDGPMAYEALEFRWLIESVREAKANCLDEEERLVIDLWSMRHSQDEIAALMHLSSNAVALRTHRAKKKIKDFLKEKHGDSVIDRVVPDRLSRPNTKRRPTGESL